MVSNTNFSEIAQQTINRYFQEFAGSLQNSSHSKALLYSQKIEKLRNNFLNYLGLREFLLSLQPNKHYLEKIIFEFLSSQADKWEVYSDRELKLKNSYVYSLREFLELKKLKSHTFIWIEDDSSNLSAVNNRINYFKSQSPHFSLFSYLSSSNLNLLKSNDLKEFSFVSYDPSEEFSEFGTVLFFFQKDLRLKPSYLGSGGAKFNYNSSELQLQELPYLLEIGTQNLISWVILAEYFESLVLDSIKNVK